MAVNETLEHRLTLHKVPPDDPAGVYAVMSAAAADLVARYGRGRWEWTPTVEDIARQSLSNALYVASLSDEAIGAFMLSRTAPAFARRHFERANHGAAYLTGMAIAPDWQRRGVGRWMMERAEEIARAWDMPVLRLDAYDAPAGAGTFYEKCGYTLRGHVTHSRSRLRVYEKLL